MQPIHFAHTLSDRPESEWERLETHLEAVATLAEKFAGAFSAAEWGRLAGLWHDLGKFLPEFQERLRGSDLHVDHSGPGAAAAFECGADMLPLSFVIAGHHAGLANLDCQAETDLTPLIERVKRQAPAWQRINRTLPTGIWPASLPRLPARLASTADHSRDAQNRVRRSIELWTRFLFSALVDADYLATEHFYSSVTEGRRGGGEQLESLRDNLNGHLLCFRADSPVNEARAEILAACRLAATIPPGFFSLTVPTGGGKTLSGLAFALEHALRHGLQRVIVGIPYTSIIEQTAAVYRDVLGKRNVLEHHSSIDTQTRWEQNAEIEDFRRLAAENWDAPVVVTTNVQLLESLLANNPSQCRKLHNLARSVIILDEAQCLPTHLLATVLDVLNELVLYYGCTIVLSTATQPALKERRGFDGLRNVREIVPDAATLGQQLRRVRVTWPSIDAPPTPYEDLARQIVKHDRVLTIVHGRRDARELAKLLPPNGRFHLSALMCPAHRMEVLREVRAKLAETREPVRLVATQLVEAGVDIDFPVVYRALAGLDSVAQAAGRCDREGRLTVAEGQPAGQVILFNAPTHPPPGVLRQGLDTTRSLLTQHGGTLDLADPALFDDYFRMLYQKCVLDRDGVQSDRASLNFATVARNFRLIEDGYTTPIVVPYGQAMDRVRRFEQGPDRQTQRALQPFIVQITPRELHRLEESEGLTTVCDTVKVLSEAHAMLYDTVFGLMVDDAASPDPAALVV